MPKSVAVTAYTFEPYSPELKRQPGYRPPPWLPGETPNQPLMTISRCHYDTASRYGEGELRVQKPIARGEFYLRASHYRKESDK